AASNQFFSGLPHEDFFPLATHVVEVAAPTQTASVNFEPLGVATSRFLAVVVVSYQAARYHFTKTSSGRTTFAVNALRSTSEIVVCAKRVMTARRRFART